MLVANLPYRIATPLLANLLLGPCKFERFCFTVQREVAERFMAAAGSKDYGPVSVLMQCTCRIKRLALLSPAVFWPRPAVESTMIRVDVQRNPFETLERLKRFSKLVRGGFAHRRKTLKFNLSQAAGEGVVRDLSREFDLRSRPEALSVLEWVALGWRVEGLLGS